VTSRGPARHALPGSGLFVRFLTTEAAGERNGAVGYVFAVLAACISGVSVYVNSLGVRSFADPVLYTTLKDGLVGVVLLVPLCFSTGWRSEYRQLNRKTWAWLVALALTGGSLPFALFYTGLQATTAATGALVNHFQFVLVALFAALFLGERLRPTVWAGMAILLIATVVGTNLDTLQWNSGSVLIAASTVLFAIDFVIAKHLLRGLATLTVMTARMTLGTAMLLVYVIASGRSIPLTELSATQWQFLVVTGVLLLLFTATTFTAIRHSSVSVVLAVGTVAPVITTALQFISSGKLQLGTADLTALMLTFAAVAAIIALGLRYERPVGTLRP
jgi:drug/metabolite transporter (DMT)-like permease